MTGTAASVGRLCHRDRPPPCSYQRNPAWWPNCLPVNQNANRRGSSVGIMRTRSWFRWMLHLRTLSMNVAPSPAQTKARDPCTSRHTLRCMVTKSLRTSAVQYWSGPKPATYGFSLKGPCVAQDKTKRVSFSGTHTLRTLEAILRQTSRQQVRAC